MHLSHCCCHCSLLVCDQILHRLSFELLGEALAKQIAQWTLDKKTGFRPGGVIVLCSLLRHLTLKEFLHLGVVNCQGCLMEC